MKKLLTLILLVLSTLTMSAQYSMFVRMADSTTLEIPVANIIDVTWDIHIPVESIALDNKTVSLKVGESISLTAIVNPSDATYKTIAWSTSDSTIATVSNGVVVAKGVGTASIIATADGVTATCVVTVLPIPVESITISQQSATLLIGDKLTLNTTVSPTNATDKTIAWSTSDSTVATVSNGVVSAVGEGNCVISAQNKAISAKCNVTVIDPFKEHTISYGGLSVTTMFADSTDVASIQLNAQLTGLGTIDDDYSVYFYYSATNQEPDNKDGTRVGAALSDDGKATYSLSGLDMCSTYYYRVAVVTFSGDIYYGAVMRRTITDILTKGDLIDLGIPGIRFASCNLGANSPEQTGNMYAWGEIEPKTSFSLSNYSHYSSETSMWRKLGSDISGTKYDAATAALGEGWHMPNSDIVDKLKNLCSPKSIKYKGISGTLYVGLNGNSIFIPSGNVWTATNSSSNEQYATYMKGTSTSTTYRYNGCAIRAVYGSPEYPMEYVDLGLSVKWATCNVGAVTPNDYGNYFAWGETEPKSDYSWSTYKYCEGSVSTLTKYCKKSDFGNNGFTDNKTVLDLEDDAAHVNWGGSWRMPTKEEQDELRNNCTWTWTTLNGVTGYKVQSKKDGYTDKWIFLPAAGYRFDSYLIGAGSLGYYWSSSLSTDITGNSLMAYGLNFDSSLVDRSAHNRYFGPSVRPVYDSDCGITGVSLDKSTLSIFIGSNDTLTAIVSKKYSAANDQVEWSSSNPSVATVDSCGMVIAVSVGTATITAKTVFGGFTAICNVTVLTPPDYNGREYVDLGLSVKWATMNVGATSPEEYGDYFAWGETEPYYEVGYAQEDPQAHWKAGKSAGYSWSSYTYCNGSNLTLTKYCYNSSYGNNGYTDNKTVLDPEDDAAHVNWGGDWRMPTLEEQDELRNKKNCTWTWYAKDNTEFNGIAGYKVQSKKDGYTDKWIFLPATGHRYDSRLYGVGGRGGYLSSSLSADDPDLAYYLFFDFDSMDWGWLNSNRDDGQSVRPVCP